MLKITTQKKLLLSQAVSVVCSTECSQKELWPPTCMEECRKQKFITSFTSEATSYCSYSLGGLWNVDCGTSCLCYGQKCRCLKLLNWREIKYLGKTLMSAKHSWIWLIALSLETTVVDSANLWARNTVYLCWSGVQVCLSQAFYWLTMLLLRPIHTGSPCFNICNHR